MLKTIRNKIFIVLVTVFLIGCNISSKAEKHFNSAKVFFDQNMFLEASIELKNGLEISKKEKDELYNSPDYNIWYAVYYSFRQDIDSAYQEIDRAIQKDKDYLDAYIYRGILAIKKGDYQTAKNALEIASRKSLAPFGFLAIAYGLEYMQNKKYYEALAELEKAVVQIDESSIEFADRQNNMISQFPLMLKGYIYHIIAEIYFYKINDEEKAVRYYELANQYLPSGEYYKEDLLIAKSSLNIKNKGDNVDDVVKIADSYLNKKDLDRAKDYYNKAIRLGSKTAYLNHGICLYEQKKYNEAQSAFNNAYQQEQDKSSKFKSAYYIGLIYFKFKNYKESDDYFSKARKYSGEYENIDNYLRLSNLLKNKNDNSNEFMAEIAKNYYFIGEYPKAIEYYSLLLKKGINNFIIYNNLGEAYFALKEYEKAEENYKLALKNNENYVKAKLNLVRLLLIKEQREDALAMVVNINANNYELKKLKAFLLFELGDEKAKTLFNELLKEKDISENTKEYYKKIISVI